MWRLIAVGVALLTGCDVVFGLDPRTIDAPAGCYGKTGGAGLLSLCLDPLPDEALTLTASIDTDTDCDQVLVQADATETCIIAGTTIDVVTVVAAGSRPLVLVAIDRLTIASGGLLDVTAGGGHPSCSDASQNGMGKVSGGAGGAGGSFGSVGGDGGEGSTSSNPNATGGQALPTVPVISVRGGCQGGRGGDGVSMTGAAPGAGGGAVYLIAGAMLEVRGTINASGEGGRGAPADTSGNGASGGGGGGSGGLIGLDAPSFQIAASARLIANGAGGGGGGGTGSVNAGMPGSRVRITDPPPFQTPGGAGGLPEGARGGGGGHRNALPGGNGENASRAAGGGGGGAGYIKVFAATAMIDPAAAITPPRDL